MKSVFAIKEVGCCYRQVIYEGQMAVLERMDNGYGIHLTSADLSCMCDPVLVMEEITETEYKSILDGVNEYQRRLTIEYKTKNKSRTYLH